MRIYDISQELLSSMVYEGDPSPIASRIKEIKAGEKYNLSAFYTCAHNGTHVDAPYHFINDGICVEEIPLEKTVGYAYVHTHNGDFVAEDATRVLKNAQNAGFGCEKRILLRGDATVTISAARVLANAGILLIGVESQSVGPLDKPMEVHLELLKKEVVLLEGLRLSDVEDGVYLLSSAPLKIAGFDGSPCRAILIEV